MPKKAATPDINVSALVREALGLDKTATPQTVLDYIEAKHPGAQINKASFSVAFYTTRKKLGIKSGGKTRGRGKKVGIRNKPGRPAKAVGGSVDMVALQQAAKFLREFKSPEAAIEAIKAVQGVQIN